MKDFKEAIAKPRKVALYAHMGHSTWYAVFEVSYLNHDEHYETLPDGETRELPHENFVRITDPVEVQFRGLDDDTVIANAVEALNQEERSAIEALNKKIAGIRERKAQLLALTHQPETIDG